MKALMKKSIVLVLISLFVLHVSAQTQHKRNRMSMEERASKQVEMMTELLDLSVEQQSKVKEINMKYIQQMADKEKRIGKKKIQNEDNIKPQVVAKNAELKQVLTPEQYEKWQEKRMEMRKDRKKDTVK